MHGLIYPVIYDVHQRTKRSWSRERFVSIVSCIRHMLQVRRLVPHQINPLGTTLMRHVAGLVFSKGIRLRASTGILVIVGSNAII